VRSFMAEGRGEEEAADLALEAAVARHAELVESGTLAPLTARPRGASEPQPTSPVAGVSWEASRKRWQVKLFVGSQRLQKYFKAADSTDEAVRQARLAAEACRRGLEREHFGHEVVRVEAAPRKAEELFKFQRGDHETGIVWYGHENRFRIRVGAKQHLLAHVRPASRTQEAFDSARARALRVRDALLAVQQRLSDDPSADVAALCQEASMTP